MSNKQFNQDIPSEIKNEDLGLINDLNAALQKEKHAKSYTFIYLLLAFIVVFIIWSYFSKVEEIARGEGSIIPTSREQIVQSLDPGIIEAMLVKEGDEVEKGQVLVKLDDTRSSAILRESEAKVNSLTGMTARLKAEAYNLPLNFPDGLDAEVVLRETAAYRARKQTLDNTIAGLSRSRALLDREIAIMRPMVQKGVMPEVELLRMERQSSDLKLQIEDTQNKYISEANNEFVRMESELAQARENMLMRADPVERSLIKAPMKGIIKNISINTVGGVVNAGQNILEIIPIEEQLLVEAYVKPRDVAFLRPGLPVVVKISAYDYSIYGGLDGELVLISPDTLKDQRRASNLNLNADQAYYRILVRTSNNTLTDKNGKEMPIMPGMAANVDIKTGEKTVFQYLIKPITRFKTALTER